ncbi:MAG: glycosyltransferase [Bacteroidales bacterium]|nr:glycosyltransferase [Bacteroidales bacterium]
MSQKKILFIASWFPDRITHSNGDFIQRHARTAALLHQVVVLFVKFDPAMKSGMEVEENDDGNYHEILIYFGHRRGFFHALRKVWRYWNLYRWGYDYIRKKHFEPDLVHANITYPIGMFALYLNLRYRKPYVISEHWSAYLPVNSHKLSYLRRMIDRKVVRRSSRMLPVTRNLKDSLLRLKYQAEYTVIPNVVEVESFTPAMSLPDNHTFIHLSTLHDPTKNITGMLLAVKKLSEKRKDFHLQIIGLENVEGYREHARELGIYDKLVSVHEEIDHGQVPERLRESMCLLLFSNFESLPCIIIEALACGIPVISSDVGGIREYLTDKEGILVPRQDIGKLVEAMEYMLDNRQKYESEHLREFALENFSPEAVAARLDSVYRSISGDD